jgi:hypothetical protein
VASHSAPTEKSKHVVARGPAGVRPSAALLLARSQSFPELWRFKLWPAAVNQQSSRENGSRGLQAEPLLRLRRSALWVLTGCKLVSASPLKIVQFAVSPRAAGAMKQLCLRSAPTVVHETALISGSLQREARQQCPCQRQRP